MGQPVPQAELEALTDRYLTLLEEIRYFEVLDERVHGWPQTDPAGRYWYGTWWSGITLEKQGGQVTYHHSSDGADNNGLRTAQLMESACYANLMWDDPLSENLLHRIIRGFSSWILAFKQQPNDPTQTLLSRAAYPESVESTEGGRSSIIDYSLNRPGIDGNPSAYVHIPSNPYWGDLWVKNKRSKDDLGHMFRGMAQVDSCSGRVPAAAQQSLDEMWDLYRSWSVQVEDDGWAIATLDQNLALYLPLETLSRFITFSDVECAGMLAIRLMGRGDPGALVCGNGYGFIEIVGGDLIKSGNKQMLRTYNEAAANHALLTGHDDIALAMLEGLASRLEANMNAIEAGDQPENLHTQDFAALIMHAANAGVPLTSREVRWLHARIDEAYSSYRAPAAAATYRVFDPSTPDGTYAYEPGGNGIHFTELGLPLGTCASQFRNPSGQPVLDCARVLNAK